MWDDKHFIYDILICDGYLYLVSTYYGKNDPPINVSVNGVMLTETGRNEYEPLRYFSCPAPSDPHITIRIEGANGVSSEHTAHAEIVDSTCGTMAVATLFKDDYRRIPLFCSYYRSQGVEKFYLYFNGAELPHDIYKADDIEYRCWNFPYWNGGLDVWAHNAQTTFLTSMYLRNLPRYNWFGLVDVDELIHHPTKTLIEYLETEISSDTTSVITRCHWAKKLDADKICYTTVPLTLTEGRTKTFYRSTYKGLCGIHTPKVNANNFVSTDLLMIHYIDEHDPPARFAARNRMIKEPTAILILPTV